MTRDTAEAIRVLSGLTRPEAAFNAGVLLAGQGRTEEAIVMYQRALAARPIQNVDQMRFDIEQAEFEHGEEPDGAGPDDHCVGRDGFSHLFGILSERP